MERPPWPAEAAIALLFLLAMIWAAQHIDDPRTIPTSQPAATRGAHP